MEAPVGRVRGVEGLQPRDERMHGFGSRIRLAFGASDPLWRSISSACANWKARMLGRIFAEFALENSAINDVLSRKC